MRSGDIVVDHNDDDNDDIYRIAEVLNVFYIIYTTSFPCTIIILRRRKLWGWGGDMENRTRAGKR